MSQDNVANSFGTTSANGRAPSAHELYFLSAGSLAQVKGLVGLVACDIRAPCDAFHAAATSGRINKTSFYGRALPDYANVRAPSTVVNNRRDKVVPMAAANRGRYLREVL